jgi:NADH:ubiquinone oxidoreductase subunit E
MDKAIRAVSNAETMAELGASCARNALQMLGNERKHLLPILHEIVDQLSYIPESAIRVLAKEMHLSPVEIQGVISFYSYLPLAPRGEFTIRVCKNIACLLKNSDELLNRLEVSLQIRRGEVTPDGKFSLEESHCLGWCHRAPALLVNENPAVEMTPQKADALIKDLKANQDFKGNWQ